MERVCVGHHMTSLVNEVVADKRATSKGALVHVGERKQDILTAIEPRAVQMACTAMTA